MIRWALTFIANRLIFAMLCLLAVSIFTQGSSCRYGASQEIMPRLANLPEALKALGKSLH